MPKVIPPNELGVTFDDIRVLDNTKETLHELVMLPLQWPELFLKGSLTKVFSDQGRHYSSHSIKSAFF
jgi:SpoVK/Ycf46/Vps4 family AAA+-type ATPase